MCIPQALSSGFSVLIDPEQAQMVRHLPRIAPREPLRSRCEASHLQGYWPNRRMERSPSDRRDPLERLIRYTARGAVSLERLAQDAHGDLLYTSTRAGSDGTTGIKLSPLAQADFARHIASPDVHVDPAQQQIRLYYHGSDTPSGGGGEQSTRVAISPDGLHFTVLPELLGRPYFRVFHR